MNSGDKKTEFGSFYIRQMLGLMITGLLLTYIPIIGWFIGIAIIILWIVSLVGAIGGKETPTPVLGEYFQDWFKSI